MTRCAQKTSDSQLYILDEDGNREMVGAVTNLEIIQEFSDAINAISELSHAFHDITFECKASRQMILTITGIRDIVLQDCPNKRVSHLAIYAKKKRTRTKNLNRAFRIAEKG